MNISVVIPAYNEEESIALVVGAIPKEVNSIFVVDNGSTDTTAAKAKNAGATVIYEPKQGYGVACQAGIKAAAGCDILVILDGDYSDYPEEMHLLFDPIINDKADFVLGSRVLGIHEPGALPLQSRWGNALAVFLIRLLFKYSFTDMGPFRAIRYDMLMNLDMRDLNFGWNVEMQTKAVRQGLRIKEVPVRYRMRLGKSKISGTISGIVRAGTKIIYSIFKYYVLLRR